MTELSLRPQVSTSYLITLKFVHWIYHPRLFANPVLSAIVDFFSFIFFPDKEMTLFVSKSI